MNKKSLILLIVTAVVIAAGIAVAIGALYKDDKTPSVVAVDFEKRHPLVKAVPSDAALVFCTRDFGKAQEFINDTTAVFNALLSDKFDYLMKGSYPSLEKLPAIMSVNYSKDMPPLLVIEAGDTVAVDSTNVDLTRLLAAADSSKLVHLIDGSRILISTSETIARSSIRHFSQGHSILEADGFSELASVTSENNVIFLSNAYADKIMGAYFSPRHSRKSGFIKDLSKWTAFSIDRHSDNEVTAKGKFLYSNDPSYYSNVLFHGGTSSVTVPEILPAHTDFAISIPVGNIVSYSKAYRNYMDSQVKLDKYESLLSSQKKSLGKNAEEWAQDLKVSEAAIAGIHVKEQMHQFLFIKAGARQASTNEVAEFPYPGFAKALFGGIFTAEEEDAFIVRNGWLVIGSRACIEEFAKETFSDQTLAGYMKDCELSSRVPKNAGFFLYCSLSEDPTMIDQTFSPSMSKACRRILSSVNYAPLMLSAVPDGTSMSMDFSVDRITVTKSKAPTIDRDTTVTVPNGPYKVTNSATGKQNTLYQNSHKSICLQDENGKDVWGIPFKEDICGSVESIDYYNNGKIQFLFGAGSKLYLLDRLGRFVGGFPVDLGKEIALGPKVYDFTGAKGYRAMVLHKDNTVGFYNLHGNVEEGWKGFKVSETIKSLPELMEISGKRYWVVRTSRQTLLFPFNGGETLIQGEGEKMIRPDSQLEVTDKGAVKAKCYDGKDRTFKINEQTK